MTYPEEGRAWRDQRGDQFFKCLLCQFWTPPTRTAPRQRPTSRARGIQVGTVGYTPHEPGARRSHPSGCQPSIREAVLGHRRDVTLRYGGIWGLGSWTLCLSPADWVQYAQGAMD